MFGKKKVLFIIDLLNVSNYIQELKAPSLELFTTILLF